MSESSDSMKVNVGNYIDTINVLKEIEVITTRLPRYKKCCYSIFEALKFLFKSFKN